MTASDFNKKLIPFFSSGYFLIFAVIVGGPIFISASAVAASLGYNIYYIFFISLFGEIAVDIIFYYVGYYGRANIVDRYGRYFKLIPGKIVKLESLITKNPWKTLILIKYSPIPIPGFVLTGAVRLNFNKFFYILLVLSVPKTFFFTVVAFLFGQTYNSYVKYYDYGQYLIISAVILYFATNYLFGYFQKKLQNKNE